MDCRRPANPVTSKSRCLVIELGPLPWSRLTERTGRQTEGKGKRIAVDVASSDSCNMRRVILTWPSIMVAAFKR